MLNQGVFIKFHIIFLREYRQLHVQNLEFIIPGLIYWRKQNLPLCAEPDEVKIHLRQGFCSWCLDIRPQEFAVGIVLWLQEVQQLLGWMLAISPPPSSSCHPSDDNEKCPGTAQCLLRGKQKLLPLENHQSKQAKVNQSLKPISHTVFLLSSPAIICCRNRGVFADDFHINLS
jgi:hypothetical protein